MTQELTITQGIFTKLWMTQGVDSDIEKFQKALDYIGVDSDIENFNKAVDDIGSRQ